MPWTYMLRCADATIYVGSTRGDLTDRIDQHQSGRGSAYTRVRLPVTLIWCEEYARVGEAWAMERKLHGWSRPKKLALAEGRLDDLSGYSRRARGR